MIRLFRLLFRWGAGVSATITGPVRHMAVIDCARRAHATDAGTRTMTQSAAYRRLGVSQ